MFKKLQNLFATLSAFAVGVLSNTKTSTLLMGGALAMSLFAFLALRADGHWVTKVAQFFVAAVFWVSWKVIKDRED